MAVGGYYPVFTNGDVLYCPIGTAPFTLADGSIVCIGDAGTFPPIRVKKGQPGPEPPNPRPKPALPVVSTPRQPGAPSVPFNPPGRIGLWPGPIFNGGSPGATSVVSSSASSIGGAVAGEGPIFVDVQNQTNLADNSAATAVDNVASAVQEAITAAVGQAGQAEFNAQSAIVSALQGTTGAITSGLQTVFGSLLEGVTGIVNGVNNDLSGIGATIGGDIAMSLNPASTALARIALIISNQIGGLAGAVAQAVALIIPEIVKAISDPIGAVKDVLLTVGSEIARSIESLTSITGTIASASTSLDATLGRVLTDYETYNTSFVESQTGWGKGSDAHSDFSRLAEILAGITAKVTGFNPKLADKLTTLCKGVDLDAALNKPVWDTTQPLWGLIPDYHKIFADIIIWIFSVIPAVQKITEETRQRMDQACPIDLLPPAALVDAVLRGYLPEQDAINEAGKGNLGESRFHLLKDLATHQLSPEQLLEALYRGIISKPDFGAALAAQGWTGGQQEVFSALGVSLLTVSESLELLRRGSIDQPTLDKILASHAYDDAQRKALASLAFRPPNIAEASSGDASTDAFNGLGLFGEPQLFTPPENVQVAGAAEGLDIAATQDRWLNHWNIGSLGNWVSLYFRQQITYQQLEAIAAREFVPASVLPALIDAQRPLVQFRTISTALRVGIIDEGGARILLRQHGYTDANIDVLIKYAQRPGPAHAPKNAQALHSVSLGIAKEEYIDGSITGDQYLAILTQHGFTVDGANTELQVVNAHQALLRRKEQAQLVIDEFGAGLIDEQGALAQLAVLGLTVDELARAAHRIRAFRAKSAKHPTEAELHNFLKNSIISEQQYVAELTASGYPVKWAQAFLAWRSLPASGTTAGLQPSTPAPTGA